MTNKIFHKILSNSYQTQPFALLQRNHKLDERMVEVILGEKFTCNSLSSIPLAEIEQRQRGDGPLDNLILTLIPYAQIRERNFSCIDDSTPLLCFVICESETLPVKEVIDSIPYSSVDVSHCQFDINDDDYKEIVHKIIHDEIGNGAGSNFVIKRNLMIGFDNYSTKTALSFFKYLLENETGAYWTFIVHTGDRTFVGASPELHISLKENIAKMNPISGTYHYPPNGPTLASTLDFLSSQKESEELCMVLEEELKMVSQIFPLGAKVTGPFLKEMSQIAHTEFHIQGQTPLNALEILKKTMFSPAVTGSPLENACRVIKKYEPVGRGYYSGVIALLGKDHLNRDYLDSSILIRTMDIDCRGTAKIGLGATIVRDSNPAAEAAETTAKAKALLKSIGISKLSCLQTTQMC